MLISQLLQVSPRLLYRKQMLLPLACIAGKPIAIYCNPDHTHLPVSIKPVNSIAGFVRDIKSFSSRYINENRLVKGHFEWQTRYGAFSYSQSQIEQVKVYIRNQLTMMIAICLIG